MKWNINDGFSDWESIPGPPLDVDTEIAAVATGPFAFEVFARSAADRVVTTRWSAAVGAWDSWKTIPGAISAGPTASFRASTNTIDIGAVRAATASRIVPPATVPNAEPAVLAVNTWNLNSRTAGSWLALGGGLAWPGTAPAVANRPGGVLDVWASGADGKLYARSRSSGGLWTGWVLVSVADVRTTPSITVSPVEASHLEVTVKTASSQLLQLKSATPAAVSSSEPMTDGLAGGGDPASVWWYYADQDSADPGANREFTTFQMNGDGLLRYRSSHPGPATPSGWAAPIKPRQPDARAAKPLNQTPQAVASASPAAGRVDVFVRSGQSSSLVHTWWTGTGWAEWEDLGGDLAGDASVAAVSGAGRIDVFSRNADSRIITRTWTSSSNWSGWSTLPGIVRNGPSAAKAPGSGTGYLVAGTNTSDTPITATWNASTKIAGSWTPLPSGSSKYAPGIGYRGDGTLDVWITGVDQSLRSITKSSSGTWGSWGTHGVKLTTGPTVNDRPSDPSRLDITGRAVGGTLWHGYSAAPGVVTGAEDLGGVLAMHAATTGIWLYSSASSPDQYQTYALGADDRLYQKQHGSTGWGGFTMLFDRPWPRKAPTPNNPEELSVTRRSDWSIDRYMTNSAYGPYVRERYDRFIAHDSEPSVSFDLIATGLNTRVYVNATGVLSSHTRRVHEAKQWFIPAGTTPEGTERSEGATVARAPTEVIDGQTVPRRAMTDSWYTLDLRVPAARHWWLYGADGAASCNVDRTGDGKIDAADRELRSTLDLVACGYKGLWLDNASFSPWHFGYYRGASPDGFRVMPPGVDATDWANALSNLLTELREALPPGYPYTINAKWNDDGFASGATQTIDGSAAYGRELAAAEQVIMEGLPMSTAEIRGADTAGSSARRALRYAEELHKVGGRVQWELVGNHWFRDGVLPSQNCNEQAGEDDWLIGGSIWGRYVDAAEYNLGIALLGFAPGDGIGDMCEYPDRSWAGYDRLTQLGVPLAGSPQSTPTSSVMKRYFTGGYVVFNSTDLTVGAAEPRPVRRIGAAAASSPIGPNAATVPPRTAAVFLYTD